MAVFVTQAKRINDAMFIEAARAVADAVTPEQLAQGLLYPLQSTIFETEVQAAVRVATYIFDQNLSRIKRPDNIEALVRSAVYKPEYGSIK